MQSLKMFIKKNITPPHAGLRVMLLIISCVITSCGFPTHFMGTTAKVEKKGTVSMLMGGSILSLGGIAGIRDTTFTGLNLANASQISNQLINELPQDILSPELGIRWGFLRNSELQFHSNIISTQRLSIRHQILGHETSIFALSAGLGILRNQIGTQRIRDFFLPIQLSLHTKKQKAALYFSITPMIRKYKNYYSEEIELKKYNYVSFIPITSQFVAIDFRAGGCLKIDNFVKVVLELGVMSNSWMLASQFSSGFIITLKK